MKVIFLRCFAFILMTMIEAMIAGYFSHDAVAANDDRLTSSVHGRVVLVGPLPVSEPRIVYRDSAVCGETILDEKNFGQSRYARHRRGSGQS